MREIKFRAWDEIGKCYRSHEDPLTIQMLVFKQQLERGVLEQFTGLHDKNGKEIYEGDIVRGTTEYFVTEVTGVIVFGGMAFNASNNNGWFFTVTSPEIQQLSELEVIGNIHENPDLLNGAQS